MLEAPEPSNAPAVTWYFKPHLERDFPGVLLHGVL